MKKYKQWVKDFEKEFPMLAPLGNTKLKKWIDSLLKAKGKEVLERMKNDYPAYYAYEVFEEIENNVLILKCDCGCNSQVMLQTTGGDLQIDVRPDGRSKWVGVWLDKDAVKQIKDFLK